MERRIAVAAKFSSGSGGAQPVATGQALRIDTLHGPSRQILHVSPPLCSGGLQVEPAPDSGGLHASLEAFSVKVEPAPDSGGLHASLEAFSVKVDPAPAGTTRDLFRCGPWTRNETEKLRGFCVYALVVSRGKIQYLVVGLHVAQLDLDPCDFR